MPPKERWYCKYPKCGDDDEAAHSPDCKSHPELHKDVVEGAILKKRTPSYCCPRHRIRHLENGYRERRRKREASLARGPVSRRVAAAAAAEIDPDILAWRRTS